MKRYVEDEKLWKSLKAGDKKALEMVFKAHYAYLHNYGLKMVRNADVVEDCLQDLFLYIFENRKNLGNVKYIRSYLFTSFRRNLLYTLKRNPTCRLDDKTMEIRFDPGETGLSDRDIIRNNALSSMINKLTPRQRELIYLRFYQEMSVQEISETTSIAPRGVTNMLYKALVRLKSEKKALFKLEKFLTPLIIFCLLF